jgi:hypothetical protein
MPLLSTKENTELKKLMDKLDIAQSTLNVTVSQEKIKIKEIKSKIKEVKKVELQKAVKIQTKEVQIIRKKIKKMNDQEKLNIRVKEAEIISGANENILPTPMWFQANGFSRLGEIIRNNPKAFKHIKQCKRQKTILQHVRFAEKLAKENGGLLSYALSLRERGHISLNICMKKYPQMFAHIDQEKLQKKPKEWLEIAEKIVKENNGILYSISKLKQIGYGGLIACMARCPDMFSHIEKAKIMSRSPEQWVEVANEISKENNGFLCNQRQLDKNGYGGLRGCMERHPDMFSHIKRKKYTRSYTDGLEKGNEKRFQDALNKHLKQVKKITEENGGITPSLKRKNYGNTLYMFVKRHLKDFERYFK